MSFTLDLIKRIKRIPDDFGGKIGNPGRRRPDDRRPRRDEYDEEGRRHRDYRDGGEPTERVREGRPRRDHRDRREEDQPRRDGNDASDGGERTRRDYRDADGDGLSNHAETEILGTDPNDADTDNDGLPDDVEVAWSWRDPVSFDDHRSDRDGDGLTDLREFHLGSNPHNQDSDGDGLNDREELRHGTDPNDRDSDDDGLSDLTEVRRSNTDPLDADTDDDGIDDGTEFRRDANRVNVGDRRQPSENREAAVDRTNSGVSDKVDVASAASDESFEPITIFRPELTDRPDAVGELGDTDGAADDLRFGSGSRATTLDEIVDPIDEPAFGAGATDQLSPAAPGGVQTSVNETPALAVPDVAPTASVEEVTGCGEEEFPMIVAPEPVDHQEMPEEEEDPPSSLLPEDLEEASLPIQQGDGSFDSVEVVELG